MKAKKVFLSFRVICAGWVAALLLCLTCMPQASAGVFSVTPVRIYLKPNDRAIAVTVTNDGDEELVMQAELYEWKQKSNGDDELVTTEDLFLSPPIIKLGPKARQVVRLARLSRSVPDKQLTYRMIVREVPEVKTKSENINLQIALAFSMPVFVTPPAAKNHLECSATRLAPDKVEASCQNSGTAYAQALSLVLSASNGVKLAESSSGAYLLPAAKHRFELRRSDGGIPAGKAKLAVSLDDGTTQNFDVMIRE